VIEDAESVGGDDDDGKGHLGGEIGDEVVLGDGDEPAADASTMRERRESGCGRSGRGSGRGRGAVFDDGGGVGGGGKAEPDGLTSSRGNS